MSSAAFTRYKWRLTLLFVIYSSLGYLVTGRFPVFPARQIPLTWIDTAVPYVPWTVLVYISYYALMVLPLLCCQDERLLRRLFLACMWIPPISWLFFIAWPVPIYAYDFSPYQDFFTRYIYWLLTTHLDTPYNTFPSLHVSIALVGALTYLWYQKYRLGLLFLVWGILVAASTLTTKRHFFWDVIGGIVICIVVVIAVNLRKFKETADENSDRG